MTGMLVFPTRLLGPTSLQARVAGAALGGGANMVNEQQLVEISGGGRIVAEFGDANMFDREKVLAWRRVVSGSKSGAVPILVLFGDRRHQPVNSKYVGVDTIGLDTWVSDYTAWTAEEVTATTTATAAAGATSLAFTYTAPKRLLGGEFVSVLHSSTWGWRAYESWRVSAGGLGSGDSTTLLFNPPLREAVPSGTALNFESPRCTMQTVGDISEVVSLLKFGKGAAHFTEWPGPLP
jgi:hypothetical protein